MSGRGRRRPRGSGWRQRRRRRSLYRWRGGLAPAVVLVVLARPASLLPAGLEVAHPSFIRGRGRCRALGGRRRAAGGGRAHGAGGALGRVAAPQSADWLAALGWRGRRADRRVRRGDVVGLAERGRPSAGEGDTDDGEHDAGGVGPFCSAGVVPAAPGAPVPLPRAVPAPPGLAELAGLAAWWPSRAADTDERNGGTAARTTPTAKTAQADRDRGPEQCLTPVPGLGAATAALTRPRALGRAPCGGASAGPCPPGNPNSTIWRPPRQLLAWAGPEPTRARIRSRPSRARFDLVRGSMQLTAQEVAEVLSLRGRAVVAGSHHYSCFQGRTQGRHAAGRVTFHGAAADFHGSCYLSLGQVGVVAQDDGLPLAVGQSAERGDDRRTLEQDERSVLGARHVRRRLLQVLVDHRPVPQDGTRPVHHGLPQVGERLLRVPQPLPAPVHRDERVLHHFLGGGRVPHQQGRQADQRPVVRGVQLGDRTVGTPAHAGSGGCQKGIRRYAHQ